MKRFTQDDHKTEEIRTKLYFLLFLEKKLVQKSVSTPENEFITWMNRVFPEVK